MNEVNAPSRDSESRYSWNSARSRKTSWCWLPQTQLRTQVVQISSAARWALSSRAPLSSGPSALPSKSSTETTLASPYLEEADLSLFDEFREPRLDLVGLCSKCGRPGAEAADRHHRQSILDDIGAGLLVARYRQHPALLVVVGLEE